MSPDDPEAPDGFHYVDDAGDPDDGVAPYDAELLGALERVWLRIVVDRDADAAIDLGITLAARRRHHNHDIGSSAAYLGPLLPQERREEILFLIGRGLDIGHGMLPP
jgi:hypothetical protein